MARTPTRSRLCTAGSAIIFNNFTGKELSYNNILDLTAAAKLIRNSPRIRPRWPSSSTPILAASGRPQNLREAWDKAFATDRQAPFGGIIAVNRELALETGPRGGYLRDLQRGDRRARAFTAEALAVLAKEEKPASAADAAIPDWIPVARGRCEALGAESYSVASNGMPCRTRPERLESGH